MGVTRADIPDLDMKYGKPSMATRREPTCTPKNGKLKGIYSSCKDPIIRTSMYSKQWNDITQMPAVNQVSASECY